MKKTTDMTSKEILHELMSGPNLDRTEDLLREAYVKNYYPPIEQVAHEKLLMETSSLSNIVLDYISLKSNGVGKNLLSILLSHNPSTIEKLPIAKLTEICLKGDMLPAVALLARNTPPNIINDIITRKTLTDTITTNYFTMNENMAEQLNQSPVLTNILKLLKQGVKWENPNSGTILASRLFAQYNDAFINEVAKYDLNPSFAQTLFGCLKNYQIKGRNKHLETNLKYNKSKGVQFASLINDLELDDDKITEEQIIKNIIQYLLQNNSQQELLTMWDYILNKIKKEDPKFDFMSLANKEFNGVNLIFMLMQSNPKIAEDIIRIIKIKSEYDEYQNLNRLSDFIHVGLSNPSLRELTLKIPKKVFDNISMTPENRKIVEEKYNVEPISSIPSHLEDYLQSISSNKKLNWFEKHSQATSMIIQEAGWKENAFTTLLASLVLILGGSTVKNVAAKMNIEENKILAAMEDPQLMEQARSISMSGQTDMSHVPFTKRPIPNQVDSFTKDAFDYIKVNEGISLSPYKDTKGILTIGIGHKILPNENFSENITEQEAMGLFQKDVQKHLVVARSLFPQFDTYPNYVKVALLDGVYRGDHKRNYKTTKLINSGQWDKASIEYLNNNDYFTSKNNKTGVHKRMKSNAERMSQYGKELSNESKPNPNQI